MSLLTRPVDELIRYILKRLHGGLIRNDLDINNFSSHLTGGRFKLTNIELNPAAVNSLLADSPVHLLSARMQKITVQTPSVTRLLEDAIIVEAEGIDLDLCSARHSGFEVSPHADDDPSEESEDESARIFGRAVEQILSNMKFSLIQTTVTIRATPQSEAAVVIHFPEISLKDTSSIGSLHKTKDLKIKGVIISTLPADPENPLDYAHLSQISDEINLIISLSKEISLIDISLKKVLVIAAPTQARIIWEIVTNLGKSERVKGAKGEEISELLHRTYLSLDDDVREKLQQPSKKSKNLTLKLTLSSLDLVLLTEEPRFSRNRAWDLHPGCEPYGFLSASHLVLCANGIIVEKNPTKMTVKIANLEAFHHELVETMSIGGSSLFLSARESYSPEFFRQVSIRDELWRADPESFHYCSSPVLSFDPMKEPIHSYLPDYDFRPSKRPLKFSLSPLSLQIKLAPVYINLKEPLIRTLDVYTKHFPMPCRPPTDNPPSSLSKPSFRISLREPLCRIIIQRLDSPHTDPLCYCQLKAKRPWCVVLDINYTTDSDGDFASGLLLSTVTNSAALFLISENDLEQVIALEHIETEVGNAPGQDAEAYYCVTLTQDKGKRAGKKEMYVPGQGTLVVPEYFRASEPYDEQYEKTCPQAEEIPIDPDEERKAFDSRSLRIRLSIHSLSFLLDPTSLQQLLDLQGSPSPSSPSSRSSQPIQKVGISLSIETLKIAIMERRLPHGSQVRVSHFPQRDIQKSTIVSTLDASAIRSRTLCATIKQGKMTDRRVAVCDLVFTMLSLVVFNEYLKPGLTYIRLNISRIAGGCIRGSADMRESDLFTYSLHPETLPKMDNSDALSMVCSLNSYSTSISFVSRLDPSQPLLRSKANTSPPGNSKEISVSIMLKALVFRIEQFVPIAGKIGQFAKLDFGKSTNLDLMKIKLQAKSIFLDYEKETVRTVLEIDDFSFWTALVTNLESKGMHAAISSAQLYILDSGKDNRMELVFPMFDPPIRLSDFLQDALGFVLVLSMDSLELFFSQVVNPHKSSEGESVPEESPPLLSCLLGGNSCKQVSGSLFMCDLAEHPLKHDILDIHLNLGCIMSFLCSDSLDSLLKCTQFLVKDLSQISAHFASESPEHFEEALAAAGVTVHTCASKGSKVNLMNLAESNIWGDATDQQREDSSDSGIDEEFEDFTEEAEPEIEKELRKSTETYLFRLPHVIHSHISFPSIVKLETIDSDFHQLRPQHGFPVMRVTASISHIAATLYQGYDFDFAQVSDSEIHPGQGFSYRDKALRKRIRREKRVLSCSLKLKQESTGVTFTKFPRKLHYASRVSFTIRDFEVLDQIQLSDVYKLLHMNREFPRAPGSHMLAVDYASVWPRPEISEEEELRITVNVLPLKINLDQYAVNFVVELLEKDKPKNQANAHIKGAVRPPAQTSAQNPITRSSAPIKPTKPPISSGFVQSLKVASVSLTLDYIPRNYLFDGVKATSAANAINLFPIENLVLTLPESHIKGQKTVSDAIMIICNHWESHIRSHEILSILGGIGPLVTVKNIGSALVNLITTPYASQNPLNSAKKGLVTLATVLSVESLGLIGTALTTIHSAVGSIGRFAGIENALITRQQVLRPILKAKYTLDRKTMERNRDKYKGET